MTISETVSLLPEKEPISIKEKVSIIAENTGWQESEVLSMPIERIETYYEIAKKYVQRSF
jgi:hypothetical protein